MNIGRPIDELRDGPGQFDIGTPEDGDVTALISTSETLFAVKQRAIYAIQLADQIDPERLNAAIPNTQQRVLNVGSESPLVCRTFLTANALLRKNFLGPHFDEEGGLRFSLDVLRDLVAMDEMRLDLISAETAVGDKARREGRTLQLPSIGDAEHRCDAFAQKAGHVAKSLKELAKLFYGDRVSKKWVNALVGIATEAHGDESPFATYCKEVSNFLLFVIEMRNMVEHPQPAAHISVSDFKLLASGQMAPPLVRIVQPNTELAEVTLVSLMHQVTENLTAITEVLLAYFCNAHAVQAAGFPVEVVELPECERSSPYVRFSYGIQTNDGVMRFS